MRTEKIPTADGGTIETLIPETPEDVEELRRRAEEGEVDDRLSMGDDRNEDGQGQ